MVLVQIDRSFAGHRKVIRAARKLGISETQMAGMLVYLWSWAADNAPDGDLSEVEPYTLARVMIWDGDAARLVNALTGAGLLDSGNGEVRIHDWIKHMGNITARREQTRNRQRRFRERNAAKSNALCNALVTRYVTHSNALQNPLDMFAESGGNNDAANGAVTGMKDAVCQQDGEKVPLASSPPPPSALLPPSLSPPSSPPITPVSPPSISPPNHPTPSAPSSPDTPKESACTVTKNPINLGENGKSTRAPVKAPVKRKRRGEHGWVLLSDEEYGRLCKDLGESEAKRCIAYVDEIAQSTHNKAGWKDWNLVVRRCRREGWGARNYGGGGYGQNENIFLTLLEEEREKKARRGG